MIIDYKIDHWSKRWNFYLLINKILEFWLFDFYKNYFSLFQFTNLTFRNSKRGHFLRNADKIPSFLLKIGFEWDLVCLEFCKRSLTCFFFFFPFCSWQLTHFFTTLGVFLARFVYFYLTLLCFSTWSYLFNIKKYFKFLQDCDKIFVGFISIARQTLQINFCFFHTRIYTKIREIWFLLNVDKIYIFISVYVTTSEMIKRKTFHINVNSELIIIKFNKFSIAYHI